MDTIKPPAQMRWHPLAVVMLVVGCPLVLVHLTSGTPNGFSAYYNLAWAEGFDLAFWAGEPYPRRLDTLLDGSGGLDFFFYGPLPFWLNSTVGRLMCGGCTAVEAFPLTGALLLLLSGPAFFALARRFAAPIAAAIGAGIYMILPYHMLADWWLRQAVGEVAAFIFMPLLVLGMTKILDGERGTVLFALALAGMVLSHLPSTMIMAYLLAAYGAFRVWRARETVAALVSPVGTLALGGALGLGLSAVYWLPAIWLLSDVSPDLLYTAYADPLNWLFFDGRPAPNPKTAFWTGTLFLAASAVAGALYAGTRKKPSALLGWVLGLVGFGLFMTSVLSAPIWAHTPIAAIQFPWRTLMVVDLGLALAGTAFAASLIEARQTATAEPILALRGSAFAALSAMGLAIGLIMPGITQAAATAHRSAGAPLATGALEYIPAPLLSRVRAEVAALPPAEPGDNAYVRWHRGITNAVAEMRAASHDSADAIDVQRHSTRHWIYTVEVESAGPVVLPVAYWRHWTAVDARTGEGLPVSVHSPTGAMAVAVPAGQTEVSLVLSVTLAERIGGGASLASVLLLLFLVAGPGPIRQRGTSRRLKARRTAA